jgi:hypothetical protein
MVDTITISHNRIGSITNQAGREKSLTDWGVFYPLSTMSSPDLTDYTGIVITISANKEVRTSLEAHLKGRFRGAEICFEQPPTSIPPVTSLVGVKVGGAHPFAKMASSDYSRASSAADTTAPDGAHIIIDEVQKFLGLLAVRT